MRNGVGLQASISRRLIIAANGNVAAASLAVA